jgi:hypothetical protein
MYREIYIAARAIRSMMDIWKVPPIIAALGMLLSSALWTAGAVDGDQAIPDLSVEDLSIEGSKDGIKVKVKVANLGGAASDQTALVLRDENDLEAGSSVLISRLMVQSIGPGQIWTKEVDWGGVKGPTHRIWAIIEVPDSSGDLDPWNNVRATIVELPRIEIIGSPMDGDPSPGTIGTVFSGVSSPMPLEIHYSGLTDPSLVYAYFDTPGGGSTFTQTDPDGVTRISLDLGSFQPGDHDLAVRVTASGRGLGDNVTTFRCREVPAWIASLGSYSAMFDPEEGCYVFRGTTDLPEHRRDVQIEGIGREAPLSLCGGDSDLQFTVRVMTDMTTTIEVSGSVRFSIGDSEKTVRITGTAFSRSPDGPLEFSLQGHEDAEFGIEGPTGPDDLFIGNGIGGEVPLIELPRITGNISATLHLSLASGRMTATMRTGLTLGGNLTQTISGQMAGLDSAVTEVRERVVWGTVHELMSDGKWKDGGAVDCYLNVSATDLGFTTGEGSGRGIHGLSPVEADGGNISYVAIPWEPDSNRSVKYVSGGDEIVVHSSNIYKSDPVGIALADGRAMVAWTEGWYTSEWKDAYSRLRVRCSVQNEVGGPFSNHTTFGDSTTRSPQLLSLAGGEARAALLHLTDPDGDAATLDDPFLTLEFYNGSGWSSPAMIGDRTTKGPYTAFPDDLGGLISASAATAGGLEISWAGQEIGQRLSTWTSVNGTVLSISAGRSGSGRSFVAYSFSDPFERGTILTAREIRSNLSLGPEQRLDLTDGVIGHLRMMAGPDGVLTLSWTDSRDSIDTIRATVLDQGIGSQGWLKPLSAKSDPGLKLSFGSIPMGDGGFAFGWLDPSTEDGRHGIGEGVPFFGSWDLSDACDIVDVTETLPDEYATGQTFVVYADLESRGLGTVSSVQVDLLKVIRESISGNVTTNIAASKVVEVERSSEIEFPVTVSENQLGLYIVCGGPGWYGPDHVSSYYLSLPAISDPGFLSVDYTTEHNGDVVATAKLENGGAMATGERRLLLMGSSPTLPMVFPGHVREPALLRPQEGGTLLNSTKVNLGSYESRTLELRARAAPGVRLVWMQLEMRPWEGSGTSHPFIARCLPDIRGAMNGSVFVREGSDPNVRISVRNWGTCAISELPASGEPLLKGLVQLEPIDEYTLELIDGSGDVLGSRIFDISDLRPGEEVVLDEERVRDLLRSEGAPIGIAGYWDGDLPLAASTVAWTMERRIFMLPTPPEASLTVPEIGTATSSRTMTLKAINGQNRSVQSMVVVLYDGLPSDGIVVSSILVPEIGPLANVSMKFDIGLPEGRYMLTVEAFVPDMGSPDGSIVWKAVGRRSGEYAIKNVSDDRPEAKPKATDQEVQRALIMSGALSAAIFVGAVANRAVEESRRER